MTTTRWLYIGCKLSELPPNFLIDSKKLTKEEIKEVLSSIPIEDGSVMADSEETLVKILISNGIFPIKIKPYSNIDNKILKLRNARNKISRSTNIDKYIEEVRILSQIPDLPSNNHKAKIIIIIAVVITTAIIYKLITYSL